MRLKDSNQENFLVALDKIIGEYKENSFRSNFDVTGMFYVPVEMVNVKLISDNLSRCDDYQELVDNEYVKIIVDEYTNDYVATVTFKGVEYLSWRFGLNF